jgi:hypothetical protein
LQSIACTSPTWCVAVGTFSIGSTSGNEVGHALLEARNGTAWSVLPSTGPGVGDRSGLHSVACSSPRWCVAVGTYGLGTDPNTLAERTLVGMRDGAGWSMVSSPNPTDAEQSALQSVTCISPVSCMAVGSYSTHVDLEDRQGRHADHAAFHADHKMG